MGRCACSPVLCPALLFSSRDDVRFLERQALHLVPFDFYFPFVPVKPGSRRDHDVWSRVSDRVRLEGRHFWCWSCLWCDCCTFSEPILGRPKCCATKTIAFCMSDASHRPPRSNASRKHVKAVPQPYDKRHNGTGNGSAYVP